jgi:hypothetical protein
MVVRKLWHGRPAHVPISTGKLPVSRCPILMRGTSQQTVRAPVCPPPKNVLIYSRQCGQSFQNLISAGCLMVSELGREEP